MHAGNIFPCSLLVAAGFVPARQKPSSGPILLGMMKFIPRRGSVSRSREATEMNFSKAFGRTLASTFSLLTAMYEESLEEALYTRYTNRSHR